MDKPKLNLADVLYYSLIYPFIPLAALYAFFEFLAGKFKFQTEALFSVFVTSPIFFAVVASIDHYTAAHTEKLTTNTSKNIAKVTNIIKQNTDVCSEVLESGFQSALLINDFIEYIQKHLLASEKESPAAEQSSQVLATCILALSLVIHGVYTQARRQNQASIGGQTPGSKNITRYFFGPVQFMSILYAIMLNWLYNGPGNVDDNTLLARDAVFIGISVSVAFLVMDALLKKFNKVTEHQAHRMHEFMEGAAEFFQSHNFMLLFCVNAYASLSKCGDDCSDVGIQVAFYLSAAMAALHAGARVYYLTNEKAHIRPPKADAHHGEIANVVDDHDEESALIPRAH